MSNIQKHKNKKAIVTGGTRGIGRAIAIRLKQEGAFVMITGTKKYNPSPDFSYAACDFTRVDDVNKFLEMAEDFAPDILINNAGINKISDFSLIKHADFSEIHQVNTVVPFQLCQCVLTQMINNRWGRIINITSIWSEISKQGRASYSASKFALDGITAALAAEVAQYGVLVNSVSPGFIETDLTQKMLGEDGIKKIIESVPMKRLGKPEEIAAFVSWLASHENTFISGQNLMIDGGFTRV